MSGVFESSYLCLELNSGQGWNLISKSWTTATPSTSHQQQALIEFNAGYMSKSVVVTEFTISVLLLTLCELSNCGIGCCSIFPAS